MYLSGNNNKRESVRERRILFCSVCVLLNVDSHEMKCVDQLKVKKIKITTCVAHVSVSHPTLLYYVVLCFSKVWTPILIQCQQHKLLLIPRRWESLTLLPSQGKAGLMKNTTSFLKLFNCLFSLLSSSLF